MHICNVDEILRRTRCSKCHDFWLLPNCIFTPSFSGEILLYFDCRQHLTHNACHRWPLIHHQLQSLVRRYSRLRLDRRSYGFFATFVCAPGPSTSTSHETIGTSCVRCLSLLTSELTEPRVPDYAKGSLPRHACGDIPDSISSGHLRTPQETTSHYLLSTTVLQD